MKCTWQQLLSLMKPTAGKKTKYHLQKEQAGNVDRCKWLRMVDLQTIQPFFYNFTVGKRRDDWDE